MGVTQVRGLVFLSLLGSLVSFVESGFDTYVVVVPCTVKPLRTIPGRVGSPWAEDSTRLDILDVCAFTHKESRGTKFTKRGARAGKVVFNPQRTAV